MGKHSTTKWVAGLFIVGLIAYVAIANPDLFQADFSDGIPTLGDGTVDNVSDVQVYSGDITQTTAFFDSAVSTIAYGDNTETDTTYYKCIRGSCTQDDDFIFLASSTDAAPAVSTLPITADISTVYAEIAIQSGQAYYVDSDKTVATNSRVGNPLWLDLDSNNRKTYVFPVDVTGYTADPNTTPTQTINVALVDEGSIDVDSPADISTLGQGKARCNIKWSADIDNSGDGEAVTRIRITVNNTDTGMWYPLDSSITWPTGSLPNSGTTKIFLNEFDGTQLASTYQYDYDIGDGDVNQAQLLISKLNGETNFEVPVELFTNFDADDEVLTITLELQTVNAQGAYTVNSDGVICDET